MDAATHKTLFVDFTDIAHALRQAEDAFAAHAEARAYIAGIDAAKADAAARNALFTDYAGAADALAPDAAWAGQSARNTFRAAVIAVSCNASSEGVRHE